MGIFSSKNKFKMDALRIKERGSKSIPTNFSESAVEFMRGMPGYYPQDHEPGHPNEREERRPDISSITESDVINKKIVKRDDGEYITGQVEVDGGSRSDSIGSYENVYDKFETNEMGQKVNPTTGATYNSVKEFIEDAQKSDEKEGYGKQTYDVDRKIEYGKNWSSSFWSNYDPIEEEQKMKNPRYLSSKAKHLMGFFLDSEKNKYKLDGKTTTRSTQTLKALKDLDMIDAQEFTNADKPQQQIMILRAYDQLILQDPDKAEQLYKKLNMPIRKGSGETRSFSRASSDSGYRYIRD